MRQIVARMCVAAVVACSGVAASASDFRVLPYLQRPGTDTMTLLWWSSQNAPGSVSISGPGLAVPVTLSSTPDLRSEVDYAASEKALSPRPADMQWPDNSNYKHAVTFTGLAPDTVYSYVATQGLSTFEGTFRTAPTAETQRPLRLAVYSDSETLVVGRTTNREWNQGAQAPGSTGRPAGTGRGRSTYFLTETVGYQENIKFLKGRSPDLVVMPGDLIQGSGNEPQRRWDEFWRHNAGPFDTLLTSVPLVAAIGNNCIFYNSWSNNATVQTARQQWSAYFDFAPNGNDAFQDLYHRQDYGPITIITLCSVKGVSSDNHLVAARDTNRAWNNLYTLGDVPDLNLFLDAAQTVESQQLVWARAQLQDARDRGQIIFVQWHHVPYSRGIHGSATTSNQSGEAMRQWTPLLEEFRVAAVFSGHSEVAERSYVDADNDGYGIHYYDYGIAGDGLRATETSFTNPFSQWTADRSEPELWNGNQLVSGGKHYGFLEVDVFPLPTGEFTVRFTPFHVFPLNAGDANFTVTGYELRQYNDVVVLRGPANNLARVTPAPCVGDANSDSLVDFTDITAVLANFGRSGVVPFTSGDANGDGAATFEDVSAVLAKFGRNCPAN
jgi:hypothetical protein